MRIQLLTFPGCAHAPAARELLVRVLSSRGAAAAFEEFDVQSSATPERYRSYASPTILVDGVPVGGHAQPSAACCRLYVDESGERLVGLPSERALRSALARAGASAGLSPT